MSILLRAEGITKKINGLVALNGVSLEVHENEILGLVGPNGAGKTTLLNIISGIAQPTSGTVIFQGEDLTGWKPEQICRKGITKTFQLVHLFPELSAKQCVMLGSLFGNSRAPGMGEARREAEELLERIGLPPEKHETLIRHLNVVELKRVQLARALASKPRLLLLDELTTGLTPRESADAVQLIREIRDAGTSILIIEHVMQVIMGVSDRIVVLDHGEKIAEGRPHDVINNRRVIETYLGELDAM
ncbi:MAG: ABC transporter ATP-binding protein [Methanomicrobiales archaeon]|nr:ABC transporter ATP-binding protein [Methanomicrobiales archaeon]MDI6877026.1 ABC transporter ATP-binding protein [Methanomicrobiales archaeon]